MPKNLPFKLCIIWGLPFNWRKKWAKEWENVKYCSQKCRKNKKKKWLISGSIHVVNFQVNGLSNSSIGF